MLLLTLTLAFLLAVPSKCGPAICAPDLYGRPGSPDSTSVVSALPFTQRDPEGQLGAPRVFAEPAFFQPRFNKLVNTWPRSMVQLPRIWRISESIFFVLFTREEIMTAGAMLTYSVKCRISSPSSALLRRCIRLGSQPQHQLKLGNDSSCCPWSDELLHPSSRWCRRCMDHFW